MKEYNSFDVLKVKTNKNGRRMLDYPTIAYKNLSIMDVSPSLFEEHMNQLKGSDDDDDDDNNDLLSKVLEQDSQESYPPLVSLPYGLNEEESHEAIANVDQDPIVTQGKQRCSIKIQM